jgi:hypothetical protein
MNREERGEAKGAGKIANQEEDSTAEMRQSVSGKKELRNSQLRGNARSEESTA